ncbi:MAG: hypothetical protein H0V12_08805 [Chloroflexi bacterium]|nr:hypothetical protein [Chloroflexota bacterium]
MTKSHWSPTMPHWSPTLPGAAVTKLVLMIAVLATLLPFAARPAAAASATCTGWTDQYRPPQTINVRRTSGPAAGTVQTVDFRRYVEVVMRAEWPGYYPIETLKAGAVAVKQYGWFHTMKYRGKTAGGVCYDVIDTTTDQVYIPEKFTPQASHIRAVDLTWHISVRKIRTDGTTRLFLTGYRSGAFVACGADADGFRIYQHSAFYCGKTPTGKNFKGAGLARKGIQRVYYTNVQVVEPGRHNVLGEGEGDAAVFVPGATEGTFSARLFDGGAVGTPAVSPQNVIEMASAEVVSRTSAPVTDDRRDDLIMLARDEAGALRLDVAVAGPEGYAAPTTWWSSTEAPFTNTGMKLVAGDFDADGRADAGILIARSGRGPVQSDFYLLRSTGSGFAAPELWWTGSFNPAIGVAYAADPTGDGRADLILEMDRGTLGMRYAVVPSRNHGGGLDARVDRLDLASARRASTRTAIGDIDRDGYDDIVLVMPAATGSQIVALRSTGAALEQRVMWQSADDAIERIKIGAADIDYDGRTDVVMYEDLGEGLGTRLRTLLSDGATMTGNFWLDDVALEWSTIEPF